MGGFSALVHKGMTRADERLIRAIPEALATTDVRLLFGQRRHDEGRD